MEAINIKAYVNDKAQISAIKAFFKALKIKFEAVEEKPYNREFVKKIKQSQEQIKKGRYTKVSANEIDKFMASL